MENFYDFKRYLREVLCLRDVIDVHVRYILSGNVLTIKEVDVMVDEQITGKDLSKIIQKNRNPFSLCIRYLVEDDMITMYYGNKVEDKRFSLTDNYEDCSISIVYQNNDNFVSSFNIGVGKKLSLDECIKLNNLFGVSFSNYISNNYEIRKYQTVLRSILCKYYNNSSKEIIVKFTEPLIIVTQGLDILEVLINKTGLIGGLIYGMSVIGKIDNGKFYDIAGTLVAEFDNCSEEVKYLVLRLLDDDGRFIYAE